MEELIGKTPLLRLNRIEDKYSSLGKILAKLEYFNPCGSIKDRAAKQMLDDAEAAGLIRKGSVIIEPTSGNTGIGLAAIGAARGYRVIIVMPDTMSAERRMMMKAYGAELVLTDGKLGMAGAIKRAEELKEEIEGSIVAGQFVNPSNAEAHRRSTGPEIWEDTDGKVDILVSATGTGGTITGTGEYLKGKNPDVHVVAVEPESSPVLSGGSAGAHKIQGIGAGFVPEILNTSIYDEIIRVRDEDAYRMTAELSRSEGIMVGISSGAAICAAIELAKREENRDKNIVVICPDTGERYLSCGVFD